MDVGFEVRNGSDDRIPGTGLELQGRLDILLGLDDLRNQEPTDRGSGRNAQGHDVGVGPRGLTHHPEPGGIHERGRQRNAQTVKADFQHGVVNDLLEGIDVQESVVHRQGEVEANIVNLKPGTGEQATGAAHVGIDDLLVLDVAEEVVGCARGRTTGTGGDGYGIPYRTFILVFDRNLLRDLAGPRILNDQGVVVAP